MPLSFCLAANQGTITLSVMWRRQWVHELRIADDFKIQYHPIPRLCPIILNPTAIPRDQSMMNPLDSITEEMLLSQYIPRLSAPRRFIYL